MKKHMLAAALLLALPTAPVQAQTAQSRVACQQCSSWAGFYKGCAQIILERIDTGRGAVLLSGNDPGETTFNTGPFEVGYQGGTFVFTSRAGWTYNVTVKERSLEADVNNSGNPRANSGGTIFQ